MLWYICLTISTLLTIRAVSIAVEKSHGKFRLGKSLIYLLIAAYIIYLPVFLSEYSLVGALIGDLTNTIQIVPLEASYLDGYSVMKDNIDIDIIFEAYLFVVGVLHCMLPIISAMTAYTFIFHCMSNIKLIFLNFKSNDVYIFSEVNEVSANLALDIFKSQEHKVDFIFSGNTDSREEYRSIFDKLSYFFLGDNISDIDIKTRKNRNIYFFSISQDENKNLNDTIQLITKFSASDAEVQQNLHIYLFSDEDEIEEMIDSLNKGLLTIRIVNESRMSCYKLLDEYPLYISIKNHLLSILIIGLNEIGVEILRTSIWAGQIEGVKLKINVVDEQAEQKKSILKTKYPEIFAEPYNINFWNANTQNGTFGEVLRNHCSDSTYITICTSGGRIDEENIRTAMFLRRFYYKEDDTFQNTPFIAVYVNDFEKHNMVKMLQTPETNPNKKAYYNVIPFGGVKTKCSYDEIINSRIEMLAKNVHMTYEDIFNDQEELDVADAMTRYNALEVNKQSNRANALHIRYKLWLLGLDYTDDPSAQEVDLSEYLDEEYLNRLTIVEHNRWMAFLQSEGWSTATVEQVRAYKQAGISRGRHNCPLLKMHPYLCDFKDLEKVSTELCLPNATIYDRELIARMADILHDKWNVNGKAFKIVRSNNEGE